MAGWVVVSTAVCAVALSLCVPAAAQEASETDLSALEGQLDELSALVSGDCEQACRALELMERAAERICALEPGERCDRARRRVADAARRVREACPSCEIAQRYFGDDEKRPETAETAETPTPTPSPGAAEPVSGPPSEDRGAGCAACTAGGAAPGHSGGLAWLGLMAWLAARRRRR